MKTIYHLAISRLKYNKGRSLLIGNGLGYLLVRIIINTQILTISQYEYPITQTLVLIVAVVIGQIAITVFVNRYIHKQSLVERMRD